MTKKLVWLGALAALSVVPAAAKPLASRQARINSGVQTTVNLPKGKTLIYGYTLPIDVKASDKGKVLEVVAESPEPVTIELWKGEIARTETNWQKKNKFLGTSGKEPSKNPSIKLMAEPGTVTALILVSQPATEKVKNFLVSYGREFREPTAEDKAEFEKAYQERQQYLQELADAQGAQARIRQNTFDFKAVDTDGQPISPVDYRGKIVLLDFWAGWCGPCREEMPNVTSTYNEFHALGFDVIGISLDRSLDEMNQAVQELNMPWRQICDGKFWDAALAKRYAINSIPASILLDENGKAIGKNLRGPALHAAVAKAVQAMNARKLPPAAE